MDTFRKKSHRSHRLPIWHLIRHAICFCDNREHNGFEFLIGILEARQGAVVVSVGNSGFPAVWNQLSWSAAQNVPAIRRLVVVVIYCMTRQNIPRTDLIYQIAIKSLPLHILQAYFIIHCIVFCTKLHLRRKVLLVSFQSVKILGREKLQVEVLVEFGQA